MRIFRKDLTRQMLRRGFLCALMMATAARGNQIVITITGVASDGLDVSGVFGPPNTLLAGQNFTLVFTVDDTKGVQNQAVCPGNIPYVTSIESTPTSNPATATLTINGHSFTFGVLNAAYGADSEVQRYAPTPTCSAGSSMYFLAGDGYYGNGSGLNGYVYPATGTLLSSDPSWESPFTDSDLYVSPVGAGSLQYEISEYGTTGQAVSSGGLIPQTITVSGQDTCSSANVSLSFGQFVGPLTNFLKGPIYMQAQFIAPNSSTLPSYAASCGFAYLEWQQLITNDPGGSTLRPNDPSMLPAVNISPTDGSLIAPPSYYDPPPSGYVGSQINPYPFYYPPPPSIFFNPGARCTLDINVYPFDCPIRFPYVVSSDFTTLSFLDAPADHALDPSVVVPTTNPRFLAFKTTLVGVSGQANQGGVSCGPGSALYCTPLFSWSWKSTNTQFACPGILSYLTGLCSMGGVDQADGIYPIIPGNGDGGITITSINGVQLPPAVLPSQVATTASGLAYSRVSETFNGTVTLTNIGSSAISGPLQILFTGMPAGVTLANATSNLSGTPYMTVSTAADLTPGQSVTVNVQFSNPSNATINLAPAIYSGSIN
jgi:hypothetical protein